MVAGGPDILPMSGAGAVADDTEQERRCRSEQTLRLRRLLGPSTTMALKLTWRPSQEVVASNCP